MELADSYYSHSLARTYLCDFSRVKQFFTYDPKQLQEFCRRYSYLERQPKQHLEELGANLKEFNIALGCGEKTIKNIELLHQGQAVSVVTGQQPGILTGPLYTVYKALGAVLLALKLSRELKQNVIPVFWIGADDHDYEEINHIFIPIAKGPKKIAVEKEVKGRVSVGNLPVPDINPLIEELAELLPPMGWKTEGMNLIKQTAAQSANLAEWFGKLMTFLFKDYGLVFINPVQHPIRKISAALFHKAAATAPEVNKLLQESCQQVTDYGYSPQIQSQRDKLHLFYYNEDGCREALFYNDTSFFNKERTKTWTREQLAELCLTNPELFSPDVVMRPVVQEELLPVLAYVAGPGEISYFALLKNIFNHFQMKMPLIYPRPNITLIEPLIKKLITKYDIPLASLTNGLANFTEGYLRRADGLGIDRIFNDFRSMLRREHDTMMKELLQFDPNLKAYGKDNLGRILKNINSFEEKARQYHRKDNQIAIQQIQKIQHRIYPLGQWQERTYNIFPYAMKYGPQIITSIYNMVDIFDWRHKFMLFD
ncbi:bacillithiol biosynthesis cysteine-adding enzyme BshC [Desulfotomaculum sp. 1211_IL3151]|uniref:bacillithiol biosynthesis cysteine-adding enzyme BshC n=1 Tax=Desulfotomaculum sp. 1211_IL3151 TaxID=3084055 RepID=UPI002FDAD10C